MRLSDAVVHARKLVPQLKGVDGVAVHVLVEACARLLDARAAIRKVAQAIDPQENLNQADLFAEPERRDE